MILALFIVNVIEAIPCTSQKGWHLKVIGPLLGFHYEQKHMLKYALIDCVYPLI